jgi:transposase-like protein
MTAKRAKYDPEIRAAAIAALLAGQSVSAVAKQYNLPKGTVSDWKRKPVGVDPTQKPNDGSESIGELLNRLVRAQLLQCIAIAEVWQDKKWIRTKGATEIGVNAGIANDKLVRMLEAMSTSGSSGDDEAAEESE